ncbi:MAG: NUDIX domain-containing protein [Gammaproteobacteria bacterium]|nr:NUDIX domain-containing protein [Gammaproteobacteria bacterium]
MDWKIHQKQLAYDGHFKVTKFDLTHEKYNGESTPLLRRELVERNDTVAMVAYDPVTDEVVLVEQFRIGAISEEQPWLIEIVAGLIEADESAEQVVIRESEEEIGCVPSEIIKIADFYTSPGGNSEWVHLYIGKISVNEISQLGGLEEEGEDIKITVVPASDVPYMLSTGEVRSAIAIVGLQWFVMNKGNIRLQWLD